MTKPEQFAGSVALSEFVIRASFGFRHSSFGFLSSFVIRISFGFRHSDSGFYPQPNLLSQRQSIAPRLFIIAHQQIFPRERRWVPRLLVQSGKP